MSQRSRYKNNLTPMMRFVSNYIGHKMYYIGGNISPGNFNTKKPLVFETYINQFNNAFVTLFQGMKQGFSAYMPPIHAFGRLNP